MKELLIKIQDLKSQLIPTVTKLGRYNINESAQYQIYQLERKLDWLPNKTI